MKNANFQGGALDESHISFIFAPRLNASGRLDDANRNVDFLLTEDMEFAKQYANELEILNNRRKIAVGNGFHAAENILKNNPSLQNYPILILGLINNEPGVVGIVASMLVEKYEKPAILLVKADGLAKGSARSVEGINIIQAITDNSSSLLNYGGHPMAAGLALHEKDISAFREVISKSIKGQSRGRAIEKELQIDSYLPFSNINDKLISEIGLLSPFGSGNTAPVLVTRNLQIMKRTTFGKTKDHVKISLRDPAGDVRQAIWWKGGVHNPPKSPIDLAYTVRKDSYRNNSGIILEWIDFREAEPKSITVVAPKRRIQITDFRLAADQASLLKPLIEEEIQFWSEGIESAFSFPTKTRVEIENSRVLGILFPPPGLPTVNKILDKSKPKELLLFNVSAPDDSLKVFLSNLGGYIKNCLTQKKGNGSIREFAALLGHREGTVIAGLHWFEESGQICLKMANDGFSLTKGPGNRTACLQEKTAILQDLLRETAAFRSFYLRMNPEDLLRIE
jgi:single-stranded-DNA-specific exonuclease